MKSFYIALVILALNNCGNVPTRFYGTITDGNSGLPLSGVSVTMEDSSWDGVGTGTILYQATTGSDGKYSFSENNFVIINGYCGPNALVRTSITGYQNTSKLLFGCQEKLYDIPLYP